MTALIQEFAGIGMTERQELMTEIYDIKIACPIAASDECQFNYEGMCMMNQLPCRGMTREELEESDD